MAKDNKMAKIFSFITDYVDVSWLNALWFEGKMVNIINKLLIRSNSWYFFISGNSFSNLSVKSISSC